MSHHNVQRLARAAAVIVEHDHNLGFLSKTKQEFESMQKRS